MALGVLAKEKQGLAAEVERLRCATELAKASAVASLPAVCFNDLTSGEKVQEVADSALERALYDLKKADKGRDDLV